MRDPKANREKHVQEMDREDPRETMEELSKIFSTANFPCDSGDMDKVDIPIERQQDVSGDEGDVDLNIGRLIRV